VRLRGICVSVATLGLMVGPAFVHSFIGNVAGARTECTITGTAANDNLNGTTKDDQAGKDVSSVLLTPKWVTAANMQATVIKDKWIKVSALCISAVKTACVAAGIK